MTIDVAIVGATGAVGQRFATLLSDHPTFRVAELVGKTSAGRRYGDTPWFLDDARPRELTQVIVQDVEDIASDVVFSAIPSSAAGPIESALAKDGRVVFTNASAHRMDPDVPLMIPDVNPDHLDVIEGRDGTIVANPNCSSVALTTLLKPVHDAFTVETVQVTTLQALSGAGYPGVPSLDSTANVIPYIPNEEEKIETESNKILAPREGAGFGDAGIRISATATRVPAIEGHTISLSLTTRDDAGPADVAAVLRDYVPADPAVLGLPTAADPVIRVFDEPDRPQPRRDALLGRGMQASAGRFREDPVTGGVKFVGLCSNTIRGAAGGSVLNAELAHHRGFI